MIHSMSNPEFKLDVQTPSAAISEIAKGMSDLRDALKCMTELAAAGCSVSALAPYLRQAWSGAAGCRWSACRLLQENSETAPRPSPIMTSASDGSTTSATAALADRTASSH